jgi:hypothetical protein
MAVTQRWVHGTSVQVEEPIEWMIRRGWGTHFGMGSPSRNWFHFSIPTLSSIDGVPLRLTKVYVFYRTEYTAIREVNVYDGAVQVRAFKGLNLWGDHTGLDWTRGHSGQCDALNSWVLQPPVEVVQGIGISVAVEFLQGEGIGISEILFTAAGAEFESS